MNNLNIFRNKYSLSKTLRFELKPQAETLKNIEQNGLLDIDKDLSEAYKKVKKIIDDYHRDKIIEGSLSQVHLDGLKIYADEYYSTDKDKDEAHLETLEKSLRKQVRKCFENNEYFKTLFKKELITQDLSAYLTKEEDLAEVAKFKKFTTYFTGFHENRKNVYSADDKSTAISYRIVHENLPKFLDNLRTFEMITSKYDIDFSDVENELEVRLQGEQIKNVFTVEFFNQCLSQNGIDFYNTLLGGLEEGKKKLQGLNEKINLYRQQNKLKPRDCPNLKPLFKQIMSDRLSVSFVKTDEELLESLESFYLELQNLQLDGKKGLNVFNEYVKLFQTIGEADQAHIYVKGGAGLTDLSQNLFQDYSLITKALETYYEKNIHPLGNKKRTKKYGDDLVKWLKRKNFSLDLIDKALEGFKEYNDTVKEKYSSSFLLEHFTGFRQREESLLVSIDKLYILVQELIQLKKISNDWKVRKEQTTLIKSFLDAVMSFYHFGKVFEVKDKTLEKDEGFYAIYEQLEEKLGEVIPLYNQVRNYLTKKNYSTEKFKLNFNQGNILNGFVESNGSTQYNGYLFRRKNKIDEYDYYLGISLNTRLFSQTEKNRGFNTPADYQRLNYYQLKTTSFYGVSYKGFYGNSYREDSSKLVAVLFKHLSSYTELSEYLNDLIIEETTPNKLFNYLKNQYPSIYELTLKNTEVKIEHERLMHRLIHLFQEKYQDKIADSKHVTNTKFKLLNDLMDEIDKIGQKKQFSYFNLDSNEFEDALTDNARPLYLFKITNKDLEYAHTFTKGLRKSRGRENLHTIYFKQLMSGKQSVYDLGSAEMFLRRKSDKVKNTEDIMKYGHHYDDEKQLKEKFTYPIIKDKRFIYDKFLLHLSITQNYQCPTKNNLNVPVLEFLQNNPEVKIIGLDRGERHLLYLSLINQNGEIEQQFTLNEIVNEYNGKEYRTDYHKLLNDKEGSRKEARKNWGTIENIKELKEGYLSQVVHKIAKMMMEHNAIVVMEDLNFGFKRGRQKVEKQIYQKFEKMLIEKLNYLVIKHKKPTAPAGVLNALQLSNKFESFSKMGKQSGFIFYLPAFLTSKIDPVTGFVSQLRPKYESVEKAQNYFKLFDSIHFNSKENWFEFVFDYKKFPGTTPMDKSKWTVCTTPHDRFRWNRSLNNSKGGYDLIKATEELQDLFGQYRITYGDGGNLISQICAQDAVMFFKEMIKILSVVSSLRQNNGEKGDEEKDFILSPVKDRRGKFFNSLEAKETQPVDADANGAYHIALKGLWALHKINETDKEKLNNVKLAISNAEWLDFAQSKPF